MQLPYVAMAVLAGGNVRVGLEDNLYLGRGELATNAQLVERAVTILEAMNVERAEAGRGPRPAPAHEARVSPIPGLSTVGLFGGGVIGAGWSARFALNGVDVALFDPDPDAARKADEVLAKARRALGRLTTAPLPPEGAVTIVGSPAEAVAEADFVQESAPERLELKRALLARRPAGPHRRRW